MLPLVTYGITEASTTRSPSRPCTRIVAGSTTDCSPVPIAAVGRARPAAQEEPPGADHRRVAPLERRCHRDRQLRRVLHVDLEMILQVLADPRQVCSHVDAEPAEH